FQSNDIGSDISNECADAIIKIVCEHNTTLKNVAKVKKSIGAMLDTSHVTNRQSNMATPKFSSETHDKQSEFVSVTSPLVSKLIDDVLTSAQIDEEEVAWMAFPVVEYYAKTNWAKHGLKRIMMNAKGFFFFQFGTSHGLEDVLEGGPWMVRNSPIILKKWTVKTSLLKEELTRIPVWIKFHDIPLQVFEEEGVSLIASYLGKLIMMDSITSSMWVSLIASYLGKPIMMDSITSSMCKDAWVRSSFAWCLVEINSDSDFLDTITIGVPDHSCGGYTPNIAMKDFKECVNLMEVMDVNATGLHFTWNEKSHEEHAHYLLAFKEAIIDEERFLRQKSKIEWLEVGDSNRVNDWRNKFKFKVKDFAQDLLKIQVAQKKVKIAFENADSSSRVELIPLKIKTAPIAKSLASHISSKGISQSGAIKIGASVSFLLSV
nr:zinc knuckle CX2CX4HX4C [Tanacetum cinerariifolium]